MATDPITGLTLGGEDRTQDVLDYLGRKSPLGLSQQAAMPSVAGASPSTAPASPGGSGLAPEAGGVSVNFGQSAFGPEAPDLGQRLGAQAAGQIAQAGKGQLQNVLTPPGQETIQAPEGVFSGVQPSGPASTEFPIPAAGFTGESIMAPAGVFNGVAPSGPASTELGANLGAEAASAAAGTGVGTLLGAYG